MSELAGKVAVVMGATSGIGRSAAEAFVRAGAFVVASGRRDIVGRKLEKHCGPNIMFVQADVCREADVQACIEEAVGRFGRIDCLVNSAGGPETPASVTEIDLDQFYGAIIRHVGGVLSGIKHAAPYMIRGGGGSIINVASVNGTRAGMTGLAYSTAKAAVIHLTRCAAIELGVNKVRVNSISPGPTKTGIFSKGAGIDPGIADEQIHLVERAFEEILPAWQSIPRMLTAEDISQLVLFLASDGAQMITGQDLAVDGGILAGRPSSVMQADRAHLRQVFQRLQA